MKPDRLKMTTRSLFLLFTLFQSYVHARAQELQYTCHKKSVCKERLVQVKRFSLSNSDTTFRSNDNGICYVTKLGTYFLLSSEIDTGVEPPKVEFKSFADYRDTVQSWAMFPVLITGYGDDLEPGDWLYCDNRCEGNKADYYKNGQKRVEGTFKKGKPVGHVKWYDMNGKVINVEQYDKNGKKVRSVRLNL